LASQAIGEKKTQNKGYYTSVQIHYYMSAIQKYKIRGAKVGQVS